MEGEEGWRGRTRTSPRRTGARCSHRVFLAHGIRQSARCVAAQRQFHFLSVGFGPFQHCWCRACCFRRAVTAVPVSSSLCPTQRQFGLSLVRSGTHLTVIFIPRIGRPPVISAWSGPFRLHHTPAHTHTSFGPLPTGQHPSGEEDLTNRAHPQSLLRRRNSALCANFHSSCLFDE